MGANGAADPGAGNRWQGYGHQQLYDMLHAGPGSGAAGTAADRWSGLANALADIQSDIGAGVTASGATWVGAAGDNARGTLGPLGDWARQASSAADVMRISTELQGDLLGKARADMPMPIPTAPQPGTASGIAQLMYAQHDYEVTELASHVAEQRAFQVMAQYEAGTTDNTGTLGEFGQPPNVVLDTSPLAATAPGRRVRTTPTRPGARGPAGSRDPAIKPARRGPATGESARPGPATGESARPGPAAGETPAIPPPAAPARPGPAQPGPVSAERSPSTSPATSPSTSPSTSPLRSPTASGSAPPGPAPATSTTSTSSAAPASGAGASGPGPAGPMAPRSHHCAEPAGAVLPTARRPGHGEEHESKYVLDAEDIYGDRQTYAPPVIGESGPR